MSALFWFLKVSALLKKKSSKLQARENTYIKHKYLFHYFCLCCVECHLRPRTIIWKNIFYNVGVGVPNFNRDGRNSQNVFFALVPRNYMKVFLFVNCLRN
eukprot:GEMP01060217.1.p1 GENE.GEMP01060217.1~~GEMP01060217.1.p1  ORF type:complete len:100 (+),score=6.63 GEMP01060217.1:717-1016(+)